MGIIPAGAGKSRKKGLRARPRWDHPRGCGEKGKTPSGYKNTLGSSPRVRGKVLAHDKLLSIAGIIPAGAGKSARTRCYGGRRRDHPRGCGEKAAWGVRASAAEGSSPRVRGKAQAIHAVGERLGIIPAGAGKRPERPTARSARRDHPRGCGEKYTQTTTRIYKTGSSPRVRGKEAVLLEQDFVPGIIPAGAGKSQGGPSNACLQRDHPRGCGEKRKSATSRW